MPLPPEPRCIVYGRVSLDRHDGKSVDQQLDLGRRWVETVNGTVVGEYRDDSISASRYARKKARPDWTKAMEAISAGEADVVWAWEVSRATRDRSVWAALVAACQDTGTFIALDGKVHDVTDPDDGFMLDLGAMLAVRESGLVSKRVLRDVRARAAQGRPHGRVAYGWKRVYTVRPDGTKVLERQEPDPEIAPFIREAAERVIAGDSLRAIAHDFDRRGVPRHVDVRNARLEREPAEPGRWDPNQIKRMVESPTNAGIRALRDKELVEDAWPAIIPMDTYRQARAILRAPDRLTHRGSDPRWLLSGRATCGECGGTIRRGKDRSGDTYVCSARGCVVRRVAALDSYIQAVLLAWFTQPHAEPIARDLNPEDRDDGERERRDAEQEVADLKATLDGWVDASVSGIVSPTSFARIEQGLLKRITDAQKRALPPVRMSPRMADLVAATDPHTAWKAKSISDRREIVAELMDIRVHKSRRGTRTLDPSCIEIKWRF